MKYLILIFIASVFLTLNVNSQPSLKYSYLLSCYNNEHWDSIEVKINGIGKVFLHFIASDTTDAALSYYIIPNEILAKGRQEIAQLAANYRLNTWNNKSTKVYFRKQFNKNSSTIIVMRLHVTDNDPYNQKEYYVQEIIVCEGKTVYQIGYTGGKGDFAFFDKIMRAVVNKNCP